MTADLVSYDMRRPLRRRFYEVVRERYLGSLATRIELQLPEDRGICLDVRAGEVVEIELREGPQIVHLFALNPYDPDERLWAQNTSAMEGAYLRTYSRLWGTMARCRPLLTVIDDTVVTRAVPGTICGKHHFLLGGGETPASWALRGGARSVSSSWERLTGAIEERGLAPTLLMTNACLFQKTAMDLTSQRVFLQQSDAVAGDRIVFFVEIDLILILALSPSGDGSRSTSHLDGSVKSVRAVVRRQVAEPLNWPYESYPYPDLSLYADASGTRTDVAEGTPGLS